MSGPSRELPPLRIRITGDNSDAVKAIEGTVKAAKDANKEIVKDFQKTAKQVAKEAAQRDKEILDFYQKDQKKAVQGVVKTYKDGAKRVKKLEKEFREGGKLLPAFAREAKKGVNRGPDLAALVKNGELNFKFAQKINKQERDERMRRNKQLDKAAKEEVAIEDKRAAAKTKAMEDERTTMLKADQARAKQVEESRKAIAKQTEQVAKEQQLQQQLVASERATMFSADQLRAKQVEESRRAIQKQSEQVTKERQLQVDAANKKLSTMVASGMQIQREHQEQIDKEYALQRKADRDRAKQVEESRKAIAKQSEIVTKERDSTLSAANSKLSQQVAAGVKMQQDELAIQRKADEERAKQVAESRKAITKQTEQLQSEEQKTVSKGRKRRKRHLLEQRKSFEEDVNNRLSHHNQVQRTIANMRALREKADQEEAADNRRILRRSRERLRNRLREQKAEGQARMAGIKSGLDGGNMMGARADIYMHQETIKSMISGAVRLIQPFAQVENYTVQMEVFAGSTEAAAKAVEKLQQFAVSSPYSLEGVLNAATTMMKYGAETEHAVAMTKMLGDVAAGNSDKLRLLGLAVGQAEGLGRLRGQEHLQMVNAGFNPLTVAANELSRQELGPGVDEKTIKENAKKYTEKFQDAMRKGKLDAGIIEAALQIGTAKGGDYAGLSDKQAQTLTGLAAQIFETMDLAAIEIVKVFAKDLNDLMKTIKKYLDALIAWMKANKDLVKSYVEMGIQIASAIAGFSALAMTIAYVKWIVGSLVTVLGALWWVISGVTTIFSPLIKMMALAMVRMNLFRTQILYATKAIRVMGNMSLVAWIKMLGPIALVIGAILLLGFIIQGLLHKDGFSGVIKDWMAWLTFFAGFFWNFSHNIGQIFNWIAANWRLMLTDLVMSFTSSIFQIAQLVAKVFGGEEAIVKMQEDMRTSIATTLGAESTEYATSMFKTDMGLGNMTEGALDFLKPHLKEYPTKIIPDKPDIDFNKFIGTGGGDTAGMVAKAAPDHLMRGSADHAVRMWEYGEQARASSEAAKQTHEKKTEDLLSKIERNTRQGPGMGSTTIEEAALV